MIREVTIPEIGENVESGQVVKVLISEGESIGVDQSIIELETDKAVVEIPSPVEGIVKEITVGEGDSVNIGQVIAKIETEGKEGAGEKREEKKQVVKEEGGEEPAEEKGGREEEEEAEEEGDGEEEPDEKVAEEEKERAEPAEKRAPRKKRPPEEEKEEEASGKAPPVEDRRSREPAPAAPSVRRLARELGADIDRVPGSGPGGRITAGDVKEFVKGIVRRGGAHREAPAAGRMPDFSKWGDVEREKLSRIRSVIAENTGHSWSIVPHVTQFDEADITELEEFRKKYGAQVEQAGGKLTVTAILLKIVTEALKRFPRFNASIDTAAGEIIKKKYYHIGVAVDTENGLLVPVIRDVDRKDLEELSVELTELAERTRERKVELEEMEGGTFTVSNQGGIGGVGFTPIVFWPQVAILGVSRAQERAVFRDGTFVPRTILPLALSYDHRIVDGADAARCLRWIVEALEHPLLLQLDR